MTIDTKPSSNFANLPKLPNDLIDALLTDYKKPEDLIGQNGLLKQLTKAKVERALQAEMTDHLGHSKNQLVANDTGNSRNGRSKKTLKGDFGDLPIEIPLDRAGSFEPQLIGKHQTRWSGFDDKILSLYARGMTVREIQAHLEEMYGAEVSPSLIFSVTDAVMDEVKAWQSRPLDALYPIVYMDCIHFKVQLQFEAKWDKSFAPIGQSWRRNWARLTPFFDYPPDIRKVIYTTNAIESVNMSLRKITKTRGSFPTDDAVFKLFYLALSNISQKWTMPIRDWKAALNWFTIQFDERMPRV